MYDILKLIKSGDLSKVGQQERIEGNGFFISYSIAGSGPTGDETAIVRKQKGKPIKYYILNGDWRDKYRPLVKKGYKACKKLFDANRDEFLNFWSD